MRETEKQLVQQALQTRNAVKRRHTELAQEHEQAKLDLTDKKAALDGAGAAVERFDSFQPTLGGELQCPECWIERGVRGTLVPQAGSGDIDNFKCRQCHAKYSF